MNMKTLQKSGAIAALYMAVAYLTGIVIFIVVLDYPSVSDPAQKVAVNVDNQMVVFLTNLLMYVFFGIALIVLALALYHRLRSAEAALMQMATAVGVIWAGSLIASGMVANAGLATIVPLFARDPSQAAMTWQGIEAVTNGLGNQNGEILGGVWTLLVSLVALQAGGLPRLLNILGLLVGALGIITVIPALNDLSGVFGLGQIIWFAWWAIILLRNHPAAEA